MALLWDTPRMLDVVNQWVSPSLFGGRRGMLLDVTQMTYRPLRQCFAVCNLVLDDGSTELLVLSFAKDQRLKEKAYDRYYSKPRLAGRGVYLPDLNCLFERFPHDWHLPSVAKLFRPRSLASLLKAAGLDGFDREALSQPPHVISYRPHEAIVVEYPELKLSDGTHLIAKAIFDSGRISRFHYASRMLGQSLTGGNVWTPVTFRPASESHVLFMQAAPGTAVYDASEPEEALLLAAEALAAIHATPVRSRDRSDHHDTRSGIDHTRARVRRIELVAPELARSASEILDRVEAELENESARTVFLHGDYKGTQLLVHDGRVAVIDLDSTKTGDPAVDVGNFLADLHREIVVAGRDDLRGSGDIFLREYIERSGDPAAERRARLFNVAAIVRMAMHSFRQHAGADSDAASFAPAALLREAEECLQAL